MDDVQEGNSDTQKGQKMTYETALWLLKAVRERVSLLPSQQAVLTAPLDVPQRLTSAYTERVTGGKGYQNPALTAMLRHDADIAQAKRDIAYTQMLVRRATRLIKPLPVQARVFIEEYYIGAKKGSEMRTEHMWSKMQYDAQRKAALSALRKRFRA